MSPVISLKNKIFLFFLCIFYTVSGWGTTTVNSARLWRSPEKTRLVFDISESTRYSAFSLDSPSRLVIDLKETTLNTSLKKLPVRNTPIRRVRSGVQKEHDLRIVLDLQKKVTAKSFLLPPNKTYGHRLVVDLIDQNTPPGKATPNIQKKWRDIVVAIDAGHGGEDPGAIAYGGGHEKNITLAIAKDLYALLKKTPGFQPVMTRTGDYYVGLRQRISIAREHKADLFVSIHADAFPDPRAKGSSVFALSSRGATSETASWLAKRDNSSDLIGGEDGVSLDDKDEVLAGVLLDLSMTSTLASSLDVGKHVLNHIDNISQLHKPHVEQAGFVVLKSPDIPSILVETGFLSNPTGSKNLKSRRYQKSMARSMAKGIKEWFIDKPPANSLIAKWKKAGKISQPENRYIVQNGDTLSEIAQKFDISTTLLQKANSIASSDHIYVGKELLIPNG
ncbi:N-acetylmuramoyl-L-alanine amidase AmiC [invertebrate metagenome]|uniref:N-acetylmuramoyl-L-alanine amidase AmiC n=1 Tax=invertebrate metagenome TaxID=1711999 RepID=A0A2H9T5Z5_9ZZZZ